MKVCTVAPAFNRHGGVPYVARNIVDELDDRGIENWVITDRERESDVSPELSDDVEIRTIKRTDRLFPLNILAFAVRALPTLSKLDDTHEFDLIHMHGNYIMLPVLADLLGKVDAPLIETAHGTYLNEIRSFRDYPSFDQKWKYCTGVYLDHLIQKYGSRFADHVHTVAERSVPELAEMGIDPDRVVAIPNGVGLAEFDQETPAEDVRASYGLEDATVAVSVGSAIPRKGVHTLVEATPMLREHDPNAHVVHVGGHGHAGYADYLKDRIAELGVADAVTLTGRVPREELLGWFETADVAVSAAFSEGCPINVLEAAASGSTVVATDVAGAPDVLGEHGIYTEPGDPEDLADAIAEGFETDTGAALRRRIEEQFTWEHIVDRLFERFEEWSR
ncbi:glycosyltransferase family 4 protein [Halapricum desulfuricans]|uniref:Glycosyltransferase n=1 Tax=Halapricum desulfuricans TaxID=2841257 RepID=A0A897NA78_9EURY|nr:glycosyltransferase family 4 protein [Halapricum desulfuricans]QSG08245.1 Glycosyltransferase [Halapricum desulfuricans]